LRVGFAVSFERRLLRDRLSFLLKLEVLTIFAGALILSILLNAHILLKAVFLGLASAMLMVVVWDRVEKAGRKLKRAVVRSVKRRGEDWFFFLPYTPSFAFTQTRFEIEAVSEDMTLVRFHDWRPWKVGEKILLLCDVRGKVLAVRDMRRPVRLEVLMKLVL